MASLTCFPIWKVFTFSKAIFNHKQYKIIFLSRGQDRSYKSLLLGTVLTVVLNSKMVLQKYLLHVFFESYPEPKLSLTPKPNSRKFTSSEHFLEITAAHSFSLHTSQGRRRIRRYWQWGLEGRQWYLLHPGLQLLAAPAAVTRGPGKVLRCSRLKACWQAADPKGKLKEESGGQQVLQWYLQGKQKEHYRIFLPSFLPSPRICLAKSQLMWLLHYRHLCGAHEI